MFKATDDTMTNLTVHFGKDMAMRFYACALIFQEDKANTDKPLETIEDAVRFTVGAVKRVRRQAVHHLTWDEALDKLEQEQVESRHYGVSGLLSREVKRIEKENGESYTQVKLANTVMRKIEAEAEKYGADVAEQAGVSLFIKSYVASLSDRARLTVIRMLKRKQGKPMTGAQCTALSRIAPTNVKPADFIELVRRYA